MENLIGWFIIPLAFVAPFFLIQTIAWLVTRKPYNNGYWDSMTGDFYTCNVLGSLILGGIILALFTTTIGRIEEQTVKDVKLESFNDKFYVHGNFTMGSGEVSEQLKYNVYLPLADGSIKLFALPANAVSIRYTESNNAHLYIVYNHAYTKFFPNSGKRTEKYTLFIPKGSIKTTGLDGQ